MEASLKERGPAGTDGKADQEKVRGAPRRVGPRAEPMRLTARDLAVVRWIYQAKLATREQIQALFFSVAGRSRCQRRLTLLYRNRFIDKVPNRPLTASDVYYISRRATKGLRLLRSLFPEQPVAPLRLHVQTVEHTLELASCRIAVTQACAAMGYRLHTWMDEAAVSRFMEGSGLRPDAYLRIERETAAGPRGASFFLEVERSGKEDRALEERYRRYGAFYYDGLFERRFGTAALRVLTLVGSDYGIRLERYLAKLTE